MLIRLGFGALVIDRWRCRIATAATAAATGQIRIVVAAGFSGARREHLTGAAHDRPPQRHQLTLDIKKQLHQFILNKQQQKQHQKRLVSKTRGI